MTTSRNPSSRLLQFLKEMAIVIPNAERINRGAYIIEDLINLGLKKNLTDIILLHEHRGQPDGLILCHLPVGPTIYFGLENVVLRHDVHEKLATMPEIYPHLIFHHFSTTLGERVTNILKHLFPVAKTESKRVITFANNDDLISFRHHTYEKDTYKSVNLNELGPRFEMKLYQISLGLLSQPEATKEWVLRPYMNTATKRKAL